MPEISIHRLVEQLGMEGLQRTALATKRLKEAISDIKKVAQSDPVTAADGAVGLMERIWPSLQRVDGSSGALGSAVNRTLETLIPLGTSAVTMSWLPLQKVPKRVKLGELWRVDATFNSVVSCNCWTFRELR